jgi:diadenosine tetraphosphatase ApaH/serine/threonine PP2A family protein phosphatase
MRYLLLADIHSNLEALEACLRDASTRGYDRVLLLGDIVGYGANPNEVVTRVKALNPHAVVRGNHDKIALGLEQAIGFHPAARAAAKWTYDTLTAEHREWLATLPMGPIAVDDLIEICHGSPFDEDTYIFDELDALHALKAATRPVCFYGHTHCAIAFRLADGQFAAMGVSSGQEATLDLGDGARYLVNPGSVGQPRDGDPRTAYAIADTTKKQVSLVRLTYAVAATQEKVLKAGLPEALARRLAAGR